MSVVSADPLSPIACMVVEADPAVRRELSFYLQQPSQPWQIVTEVDSPQAAWDRFLALQSTPQQIRVVILGLPLEETTHRAIDPSIATARADRTAELALYQQLKLRQPDLRVVLLANPQDPALAQAWELGIEGCVSRETGLDNVATVMSRVIRGDRCWLIPFEPPQASSSGASVASIVPRTPRTASGLQQIDAMLADLEQRLRSAQYSWLERQILQGRCRELRAARWLVQQISPSQSTALTGSQRPIGSDRTPPKQRPGKISVDRPPNRVPDRPATAPIRLTTPASPAISIQEILFERLTAKLSGNLENLDTVPLEIDILRRDRKQELLYLILRKFEAILQELALSEALSEQLASKRQAIMVDLWESAVINFFGKYYTLQTREQAIEVVPILLRSSAIVQRDILDRVPLVPELLSYLLFQTPLTIDNAVYAATTPEALDRGAILLENLILQTANAVIQPLLNQFADWEPIKQSFYDRRHLSTREIARFRNDLSWRYRRDRYLDEPANIFESQYRLWNLTPQGIRRTTIYAPRRLELDQLEGIPLAVTLVLETRDAIAPRLRAAVAFVGSGVVYVLTEVVGRGLGLIGRGIAKGIGDAWQGRR